MELKGTEPSHPHGKIVRKYTLWHTVRFPTNRAILTPVDGTVTERHNFNPWGICTGVVLGIAHLKTGRHFTLLALGPVQLAIQGGTEMLRHKMEIP